MEFAEAAGAFHLILVERSGNQTLSLISRLLGELTVDTYLRALTAPQRFVSATRKALRSYDLLLSYIEAGDVEQATDHWRRHMAAIARGPAVSDPDARVDVDRLAEVARARGDAGLAVRRSRASGASLAEVPAGSSEVRLERREAVAIVTLAAPDRLNAVSRDDQQRLREIWDEIREDAQIRSVVVTGEGRGFCAGAHMDSLAAHAANVSDQPAEYSIFTPRQCQVFKPVITAVNGVCAGAGLHFIVDSDIVIVSENASFTDPHVDFGQVSGPGAGWSAAQDPDGAGDAHGGARPRRANRCRRRRGDWTGQ